MIGITIFVFSVAMAIICISYDSMASSNGWPVGEILIKDASLPKVVGFITIIWTSIKAYSLFAWWTPLSVLIVGWIIAFALTMMLKKNVQLLCVPGVFIGLCLTIFYVSEKKPFGMLQNLFS